MKVLTAFVAAAALAVPAGLAVGPAVAATESPASAAVDNAATQQNPRPAWVDERIASALQAPRMSVRSGKCDMSPGADCKNKDMRHLKGKMKGKDMSGSDMSGADMRGMDLRGTNFNNADLTGAKLQGASMEGAKFKGAMMMKVDLSGMKLHKMHMQGANIMHANLKDATISKSHMKNALIMGGSMKRIQISGTDMRRAVIVGDQKTGRSSSVVARASVTDAVIVGSDFSHAWVSGITNTQSRWQRNKLWLVGIENSNLSESVFDSNTFFETTYISGSNLSRSLFYGDQWGSQFLHANDMTNTRCSDRMTTDRQFMTLDSRIKYKNDSQNVYVGNSVFQFYVGYVIDTSQWWFPVYRDWFNFQLGDNDWTGSNCPVRYEVGPQQMTSNADHP